MSPRAPIAKAPVVVDKSRWSRRALLKAAGLGAVFVPLLDAEPAQADTPPVRRLIVMQWTNGVIPDAFWPKGGETDFTLPETLSPLEAYRKDLLLLGPVGLKCQGDSKAQGAGVGHQSLWALLTGVQAAQGRNDGGPCGIANGISVDQYVANAIAKKNPTKFKSIELGAYDKPGKDNERAISYRGPAVAGRPADNPPEISPYNIWNRLFKDLPSLPNTGMPGMDKDFFAKVRAERKSVLDFVGRELGALQKKVGKDDSAKIDEHLSAMRQLEAELTSLEAGDKAACMPTAPAADLPWYHKGDQINKIVPVQLDLMTMAMRCDLTRVATMMMCTPANDGIYYHFLGDQFPATGKYLEGDHHGIAHAAGSSAGSDNGKKKVLIDQWWVKQFAYVIDRLKKTPEGTGTMLDNSLVVLANHMDVGAGHGTGSGVPFLMAGRCGGYFKTGRYVAGHARNTPHNQILVAMANAMLAGQEAPLTSFGDPQYGGELPRIRG